MQQPAADTLVHLVSCRAGQGLEEVRVGDYANLAVGYGLSEALHSSSMSKQYMVAGPPVIGGVFVTGGVCPNMVPHLWQDCTAVDLGWHMAWVTQCVTLPKVDRDGIFLRGAD